jgi:hypothetical protein
MFTDIRASAFSRFSRRFSTTTPPWFCGNFDFELSKYDPDASDPDYLVYRRLNEHLEKTVGRKQDAEKAVTIKGSGTWLAKKFRKLEAPIRP